MSTNLGSVRRIGKYSLWRGGGEYAAWAFDTTVYSSHGGNVRSGNTFHIKQNGEIGAEGPDISYSTLLPRRNIPGDLILALKKFDRDLAKLVLRHYKK